MIRTHMEDAATVQHSIESVNASHSLTFQLIIGFQNSIKNSDVGTSAWIEFIFANLLLFLLLLLSIPPAATHLDRISRKKSTTEIIKKISSFVHANSAISFFSMVVVASDIFEQRPEIAECHERNVQLNMEATATARTWKKSMAFGKSYNILCYSIRFRLYFFTCSWFINYIFGSFIDWASSISLEKIANFHFLQLFLDCFNTINFYVFARKNSEWKICRSLIHFTRKTWTGM